METLVKTQTPTGWRMYHRTTRTATYGFLSALPLLLIYEISIVLVHGGGPTQVRIGAEIWLKQLLALLGGTGLLVSGAVVLVVGAAIFWAERKRRIPLRPRYFAAMVGESAVYAVLVAALVAGVVGAIFAAAPAGGPGPQLAAEALPTRLALSIGAGIYEELLFRVLLVGGLYLVLARLFSRRTAAYVAAAVVGAFLFSAVHYVGALGDAFTLPSFVFRFLFGLVLNVLFLVRGFGVAAWTHALYDVMVVVLDLAG